MLHEIYYSWCYTVADLYMSTSNTKRPIYKLWSHILRRDSPDHENKTQPNAVHETVPNIGKTQTQQQLAKKKRIHTNKKKNGKK